MHVLIDMNEQERDLIGWMYSPFGGRVGGLIDGKLTVQNSPARPILLEIF